MSTTFALSSAAPILARLRLERLNHYLAGEIDVELLQALEPDAAPWQGAADLADALADSWDSSGPDPVALALERVAALEPTPEVGTDAIRLAGPLAQLRRELHGGGWGDAEGHGLSAWDLVALVAAGILTAPPVLEAGARRIVFVPEHVLRGEPRRGGLHVG